jgi:hypothetical protein
MFRKKVGIISITAFSLVLFALPAVAGTCEGLTSLALADGKITSASLVEAGQFTPPVGGGPMMGGPGALAVFKNAPSFCRVTATLTPTADSDIKVEVWMPSENWNGKLVGTGNGVWAGTISYSAMAEPLSRGYATVATSYFRDVVFNDPEWDFKSFDYDKDLKAAYEAGSDILDVPSDGFSRFFQRGGKLLLSHGWADGLIPASNTVEFYKSMIETMDPKKASDSVRLFMLPGVSHCAGGDGPSAVDMLSVIDAWASKGKAPDSIIASRPSNQEPMTRPICPYPQIPVYKGSGKYG